jgi:hypothetical protein
MNIPSSVFALTLPLDNGQALPYRLGKVCRLLRSWRVPKTGYKAVRGPRSTRDSAIGRTRKLFSSLATAGIGRLDRRGEVE